MKIILTVVMALFLSGCMSQTEYDAWKERNRADSMTQSSSLSVTGAGLTFSNGSAGAMNNYSFNQPIDKKKLDAEVAARRAKAQQVADEAGERVDANIRDMERKRQESAIWMEEQRKKQANGPSCETKAVNTIALLRDQAYMTGDYSMYMKYDYKTLVSLCKKGKL